MLHQKCHWLWSKFCSRLLFYLFEIWNILIFNRLQKVQMNFYSWLICTGCFCDISSRSMIILILLCLQVYTLKICCRATFSKEKGKLFKFKVPTFLSIILTENRIPFSFPKIWDCFKALVRSVAWHNKNHLHYIVWSELC